MKIEAKSGNVVPLELNAAQMIIYRAAKAQEDAGKPVRLLLLKGRQQGASTWSQAWLAWKAFTREGTRCLTVAHELGPAAELFGKTELFYDNLPGPFKPDRSSMRGGRRLKLDEPLRSLLLVETAEKGDSVGRSGTFRHVHLTEVPFWKNQDATISALEACVPNEPDTSIIIESTARGRGNWFHRKWMQCIKQVEDGEDPEYMPVFVPWFETPEYADDRQPGMPPLTKSEQKFKAEYKLTEEQVLWYRKQSAKDADLVVQEYPSNFSEAFLSTGMPFFRSKDLEFYQQKVCDPLRRLEIVQGKTGPECVDEDYGRLWVWQLPRKDRAYVVGVDVAGGRARDFSTIQVFDVDTLEQAASFQAKMDPADIAQHAAWIGLLYRGRSDAALVAPERNNVGEVTVDRLVNTIRYPKIYTHVRTDTVSGQESDEFGWKTTVRTRPVMLEELARLVHTRQIKLNCERTLTEMQTFVYNNDDGKKAEAGEGCNDDLVMALAICVAVRGSAGGVADFSVVDDDLFW